MESCAEKVQMVGRGADLILFKQLCMTCISKKGFVYDTILVAEGEMVGSRVANVRLNLLHFQKLWKT